MSYSPENIAACAFIDEHTANLKSLPTGDAKEFFHGVVKTTFGVLNGIRQSSKLSVEHRRIISDLVEISWQTLKSDIYPHSISAADVLPLANKWISDFSQRIDAHLHSESPPDYCVTHIPLEIVQSEHPNEVKLIPAQKFQGKILEISQGRNVPTQIPLSDNYRFWYRGGACRTVLKVAVGAHQEFLNAEFPLHDLDIGLPIESTLEEERFVRSLGIDAGSIEYCRGQKLNLPVYFYSRDTTLNQAVLTNTEIIFTNEAKQAALTGQIIGTYGMTPERALYGPDMYYKNDKHLYLARGLSRVVKSIVEGKASSFLYYPENKTDDIRPYVLFLMRRWSYRDDYPTLATRLNSLMQQMGQTLQNELSATDLIADCIGQYQDQNYYSLNSDTITFKWKITKLRQQLYRILEETDHDAHPLSETKDTSGPISVSLNNFERNLEEENKVRQTWDNYVQNHRI